MFSQTRILVCLDANWDDENVHLAVMRINISLLSSPKEKTCAGEDTQVWSVLFLFVVGDQLLFSAETQINFMVILRVQIRRALQNKICNSSRGMKKKNWLS